MTWWSEHSAVPGFVLAKLAIRCLFVDRFVGSRVPSLVSGQRFSTHDASLPSAGSRQAQFPVIISTMKALRLPAHANLVPYSFGSKPHTLLLDFVFAKALLSSVEEYSTGLGHWLAGIPLSGFPRVGASGISQVPWRSILCFCPAPRPRPSRQNLAHNDFADAVPGLPMPKTTAVGHIGADTRLQHSTVYASRVASLLPMQDSLPAGELRLCREGIKPSGPLRKVSGYIFHSPFQSLSCRNGSCR